MTCDQVHSAWKHTCKQKPAFFKRLFSTCFQEFTTPLKSVHFISGMELRMKATQVLLLGRNESARKKCHLDSSERTVLLPGVEDKRKIIVGLKTHLKNISRPTRISQITFIEVKCKYLISW